ncbi:hypothetical protein [Rhodocista pekingensis]|uniref:Membrane-associated oxidoreductase n=1 Tax=Rhodocista pekingensis TaxID=201185 RepID=A0ABW2L2L3_9PROT
MPTDLPENDRALVEAAQRGKIWAPAGFGRPNFDGEMPTVQADTIRALCLGLWDDVRLDPRGVRIFGARIDGELDLSDGISVGPLKLLGCHLQAPLILKNATLPSLYLSASRLDADFNAEGAHINGDLYCTGRFQTMSAINLIGARIGGDLDLSSACLDSDDRSSLVADRIVIKGNVFCAEDFNTKGTVRLLGAHIGGDADFGDASLDGGGKAAINADGMVIQGGLFFREGTSINGDASLVSVSVQGLLDWRPASWTGILELSHARAGVWADTWSGQEWNCDGEPRIDLRDFRFDSFLAADYVKADAGSRLNWLKTALGDDFVPGPYENLARVLRAAGEDAGAKRVGLEKERARTRHAVKSAKGWLPRSARWFRGAFLDLTIGYGYEAWRGFAWLLALLLVGWGIFYAAGPLDTGGSGIIKPALPVAFIEDLGRRIDDRPLWPGETPSDHGIGYRLPPEYPPFSGFWYSLDTLLPLVDLGQSAAWSPSPIAPAIRDDPWGWTVTIYLYFHIMAGWVLSTLTVVALTGLIRREDGRRSE